MSADGKERGIGPGSVVAGRYRVEKLLGEGAMGAVYLVEHVHMRKRFALKVLLSEARENPEIVARFEREAVAAANVDHPNVVAASDFGTTEEGSFFLVLEYIEGESLRDVLDRGALPLARVVPIANQIGSALAKAHGMGIVHRDLKPENVMLVPRDGEPDLVKVLDFGIAKVPTRDTQAALTAAGAIFGTPEYMSPEQAIGQPVDARADMYSFGIMLFEMLVGQRPFDAEHVMGYLAAHLNTPVPPMREIAPSIQVPDAVEAVIRTMLAKVPEERFGSVREAVAALEAAAGSEHGFSGPSPSPSPASARFSLADASAKTLLPGHDAAPPSRVEPRSKGIVTLTAEGFEHAKGVTAEGIEHAKVIAKAVDDALPPKIKKLPTPAKAGAAAAIGTVALIVVAGLFAGGKSKSHGETLATHDAAATAPTPGLSDEAIGRAATEGPAALDKLLAESPKDKRVHHAKIRALRAESRIGEAVAALDGLLAIEPAVASDPATAELLLEGLDGDAQLASGTLDVVEKCGATGVDVLLACVAKPSKHKKECTERLGIAKVRAEASPGAKIFLDFKDAQGCQAKWSLLDRAKDEGDQRMVPQLKPLTYTSGCGFFRGSDCWKCLRRDKKLPEALAAVEGRAVAR